MASDSSDMEADPEQEEGPEQDRQDRRYERLDPLEVHEIVMGVRHDHADDHVCDAQDERENPAHEASSSSGISNDLVAAAAGFDPCPVFSHRPMPSPGRSE